MTDETTVVTERTVTDTTVKEGEASLDRAGFPSTGHMKRDGNTFVNESLGDSWDKAVDAIEEVKEKIREIE